MSTTRIQSDRGSDRYLALVRAFPLRPIRSAKMHQEALRVLRSLSNEHSHAAVDYKSVLVSLIEQHEEKAGYHIDTAKVSAADVVRHILDQHSMSVNALAKELDIAQSALSEMLSGKRDWSKSVIVALSNRFKLKPELFLR